MPKKSKAHCPKPKAKRRKHSDAWYDRMLFGMLCESIADACRPGADAATIAQGARAESLLTSYQPEAHRIIAEVRYVTRGPAGLLTWKGGAN